MRTFLALLAVGIIYCDASASRRAEEVVEEDTSALIDQHDKVPEAVEGYWKEKGGKENAKKEEKEVAKSFWDNVKNNPKLHSIESWNEGNGHSKSGKSRGNSKPKNKNKFRSLDSYTSSDGTCGCATAVDTQKLASCLTWDRQYNDCLQGSYAGWMCSNCGYSCCMIHAQENNADTGLATDSFADYVVPAHYSDSSARIVNGFDAKLGQFPYQVAITNYQGGQYCGGTIIGNKWVVTAAHCLYNTNKGVYEKARNVYVRVGVTDLDPNDWESNPHQQIHKTEQVICHSDYDSTALTNDICLIKLAKSITFNDYVKPAALATVKPAEGTPMQISGWGKLTHGGSATKKLQFATFQTYSDDATRKIFGGVAFTDGNVAGNSDASLSSLVQPTPTGTCQGDSGGPAVTTDSDGYLVLAGIVSYGAVCAEDPSVFTSVAYFYDWIASTVTSNL
jgi:hypothetical protein